VHAAARVPPARHRQDAAPQSAAADLHTAPHHAVSRLPPHEPHHGIGPPATRPDAMHPHGLIDGTLPI